MLRQEVPHLIDFHCLPHHLELALLEMQRSCKLVETVYEVLLLIWKTYHYSPKSTRELEAVGTELGVNVLTPTQVSGTRWLPHISRALKVMIEPGKEGSGQYAAVLSYMDHLSAASKNTDVKGRAKYVAEKMRSIQFSAFCHFLADMFEIIAKLSLKMQRNDLILPVAVSLLHETVANIEALKIRPVPNEHLARFMNMLQHSGVKDELRFQGITLRGSLNGKPKRGDVRTGSFQSRVNEAIGLCLTGLEERFGSLINSASNSESTTKYGTADVINDLLVFNVDAWPKSTKELVDFGNEKIECLVHWFQPLLQKAGCDVSSIPEEWFSSVLVDTSFRDKDYASLWETLLIKTPYKDDFENVLHLVEILLVKPISAVQCERAISAQNRIKSSVRVNLAVSTLEDLIRISAEGPPAAEFDPTPSVNKWLARNRDAGERLRRPHFQRSSLK